MTDKEAPTSSRVRAAEVVLSKMFKGIELDDIEARVAQLEQAAQGGK